MITIFDVAKEAGVSKSTVSRVINNDSRVSEDTRIKVEEAIRKLQYSPSYMAQAIRTRRTKTIALLVPEYTNVFYSEMFRGVEDVALHYGYMVIVCNTERHTLGEKDYIRELLKRNIDGIIYNCYKMDDDMKTYLREMSKMIPFVFMNNIFGREDHMPSVYTDGVESTRKAVHYLYNQGRRKIAYVRNSEDISVTEDRYAGYLKGLNDVGLSFDEKWVYQVQRKNEPDYAELGKSAAKYFLSIQERPDAVLTVIDMIAIGCLKEFQNQHIKIPQELSLIGFDNISFGALTDPSLTTISQPIRKMGQTAAEILISKIEGKESVENVVFNGDLIVRQTT